MLSKSFLFVRVVFERALSTIYCEFCEKEGEEGVLNGSCVVLFSMLTTSDASCSLHGFHFFWSHLHKTGPSIFHCIKKRDFSYNIIQLLELWKII